jgi:hypothetical protein
LKSGQISKSVGNRRIESENIKKSVCVKKMQIKPNFKENIKQNLFNKLQTAKQPVFGYFNRNYLNSFSNSSSEFNREYEKKYIPERNSNFLIRHNFSKIIREESN